MATVQYVVARLQLAFKARTAVWMAVFGAILIAGAPKFLFAQAATVTCSSIYRVFAVDAGLKYRGVFLQTEFYARHLRNFEADGPLPVTSISDKGFYVQG
jgi:hypothetical protein